MANADPVAQERRRINSTLVLLTATVAFAYLNLPDEKTDQGLKIVTAGWPVTFLEEEYEVGQVGPKYVLRDDFMANGLFIDVSCGVIGIMVLSMAVDYFNRIRDRP